MRRAGERGRAAGGMRTTSRRARAFSAVCPAKTGSSAVLKVGKTPPAFPTENLPRLGDPALVGIEGEPSWESWGCIRTTGYTPPFISLARCRFAGALVAGSRSAQASAGVSTWPRTEWCPSFLRVTRPVSGQ
jgi:hypothetical protein